MMSRLRSPRPSGEGWALAERLGIGALVAAFSAWHWRQLERPEPAIAELAGLILLAAAPAVLAGLGRRRLAIAAAIATVPTAIWVGFDYLPWQRNHPLYPIRLGEGL